MDWASAKYTLLISADDALAAGALARAAYVMDHHEEVSMTYGKARIVRGESLPPDIDEPETLDYAIIPGPRFLQRSCVWNPVLSPTAVVRTELQQRTGGYSPKMLHTSDMEMWMRLATFSSIGAVEAVQGHYRWHGANMNVQYGSGVLGDRRQRLETCEYVFEQWGGSSVQGFASWIAESRKALALDAYWLAGLAVERSDEAGTREYLAFADACDPSLRGSRHAWRLKAKRLLGPTLTRTVRGVLGRTDRLEMTDPEPGWWPDADEPFIQIVRAPNADTRCAASQAPQKANATWR
jgi:hypothetical protein